MNVLALVTDAFGGHGGIARYNRNALSALSSHPKCRRVVALPRVMLHRDEPLPERLKYVVAAAGSTLRYLMVCIIQLVRTRYHLIVCSHINLLPLAVLASTIHRAPLILSTYGMEAWNLHPSFWVRHSLKRIQTLISIQDVTIKRLKSWSQLNSVREFILHNAIRPEDYSPGPKNVSLVDRYGLHGKRVIMTLGRMASDEPNKGYDEVLEILPALTQKIPNLVYVAAGGGADQKRLEKKAADLGVSAAVVFTDTISPNELVDHYRLADVLVMAGRGQNFDRYPFRFAFLEALACGVPVIGCTPRSDEVFPPEACMITQVDPHNPQQIERGVLLALEKPRGEVPVELKKFSYAQFERALHHIMDETLAAACGRSRR